MFKLLSSVIINTEEITPDEFSEIELSYCNYLKLKYAFEQRFPECEVLTVEVFNYCWQVCYKMTTE
jgi:hypothetical protein